MRGGLLFLPQPQSQAQAQPLAFTTLSPPNTPLFTALKGKAGAEGGPVALLLLWEGVKEAGKVGQDGTGLVHEQCRGGAFRLEKVLQGRNDSGAQALTKEEGGGRGGGGWERGGWRGGGGQGS